VPKKPRVTDIDDQAVKHERRWGHAISEWQQGRPELLRAEFGRLRIPGFAKEFLNDLALGKAVRRPKGRPPERTAAEEREIAGDVFSQQQDSATNQDEAIAAVAERRGMREGQVRGIFEKMRAIGFQRWMFDIAKRVTEARNRDATDK
jgi:hypothetical protein